jgi:hypothetical protein
MIFYTLTPNNLSVFVDGHFRTIHREHQNFASILEELRKPEHLQDFEAVKRMLDLRSFVSVWSAGAFSIGDDGSLRVDDKPIHSALAARIVDHFRAGLDPVPLCLLYERIATHPDRGTAADLWAWIDHAQLPITTEGNIIAFKKVRADFCSYHRNRDGVHLPHEIGSRVSIPRSECDTSRDNTCSSGLHFCSYEYLPDYYGNEGRVLVLEIDPMDVVAIPQDYKLSKGRACAYTVIGEVAEDEAKEVFAKTAVLNSGGLVSAGERGRVVEDIDVESIIREDRAVEGLEEEDEWPIDDPYDTDEYYGAGAEDEIPYETGPDDEESYTPAAHTAPASFPFDRESCWQYLADPIGNRSVLNIIFTWYYTPQGYDFWRALEQGCGTFEQIAEARQYIIALLDGEEVLPDCE